MYSQSKFQRETSAFPVACHSSHMQSVTDPLLQITPTMRYFKTLIIIIIIVIIIIIIIIIITIIIYSNWTVSRWQ
jgi:hypothetical protein